MNRRKTEPRLEYIIRIIKVKDLFCCIFLSAIGEFIVIS